MDPNASWNMIRSLLRSGEIAEAAQVAHDLLNWLGRGGFYPDMPMDESAYRTTKDWKQKIRNVLNYVVSLSETQPAPYDHDRALIESYEDGYATGQSDTFNHLEGKVTRTGARARLRDIASGTTRYIDGNLPSHDYELDSWIIPQLGLEHTPLDPKQKEDLLQAHKRGYKSGGSAAAFTYLQRIASAKE